MSNLDPLLQQMRETLGLEPRAGSAPTRARRFSDADGRGHAASYSASLEAGLARSNDGSRTLPMPDEQKHIIRKDSFTPAPAKPTLPEPLVRHTCSASSCSLAKAFQTPELLELILSFLHTRDILTLRTTNRMWNSVVRESPQLRLHLFVLPNFSRDPVNFQLLDLKLDGLSISVGGDLEMGCWLHVTMNVAAARKICPEPSRRIRSRSIFEGLRGGLGLRVQDNDDAWPAQRPRESRSGSGPGVSLEDLLVMQPPVLGMLAYTDEAAAAMATPRAESSDLAQDAQSCSPYAKLYCETGITLGFLADTALASAANAPPDGGTQPRVVEFKAIISFCPPSPRNGKRSSKRIITRIG